MRRSNAAEDTTRAPLKVLLKTDLDIAAKVR